MAGLDIAVKRRPQDGRSAVRLDGRPLRVRVSTLPRESGAKVVVRLLDPADAERRLEDLGLGTTLEPLQRLLGRGHGVGLVRAYGEAEDEDVLRGNRRGRPRAA